MALDFPLHGDRLALRPFAGTDLEAAHRIYGDPEVMRYVGEGGAVTREASARMLTGCRRHRAEHGFAFWAVRDRATGTLIGDAGLEATPEGVELGCTLAREWWGPGSGHRGGAGDRTGGIDAGIPQFCHSRRGEGAPRLSP